MTRAMAFLVSAWSKLSPNLIKIPAPYRLLMGVMIENRQLHCEGLLLATIPLLLWNWKHVINMRSLGDRYWGWSHFDCNLWSIYAYFIIVKSEDLYAHEMIIYMNLQLCWSVVTMFWAHSPISLNHMCFGCWFLVPHITTYHSNTFV